MASIARTNPNLTDENKTVQRQTQRNFSALRSRHPDTHLLSRMPAFVSCCPPRNCRNLRNYELVMQLQLQESMKLCNCRWVDGAAVTVPKLQNGWPLTVTLTWLSSRSGHCRNNKLQAPHTCCWGYYHTCMASSAENKSFCDVLKYVINTRSHCPKLMKFINELSKQMKFERAQLRIFFKKKFGSRSKSEKRSFTQLIHEIVLYGLIIIKYVFLSFVF